MSANLRQSAYRALGGVMLLGITLVQPLVFSAFAEEPAEIRPPEVRFKATDSIGRSLKLTSQLSAKWEVRESRPVLAIHWEGLPGTASALGKSFGSDGEFNGISINSRVGPRSSLILDIQTDARITRVENFEAVMKFEVPESTPTYLSIEDSCTDLGLGIRAPETQAPLVLGLACVRLRGGIVVSRFFTPKELDARPGPRGSGTLIQPGEIEFTRSVSSLKAADEGEVLGEAVRGEGAGTLEVVRVSNRKPLGFSVFRRWHADISAGAAFLSGSNTGQGSLLLRTELLPDALEFVADGSKILKDSLLTAGVRLGFPAASHGVVSYRVEAGWGLWRQTPESGAASVPSLAGPEVRVLRQEAIGARALWTAAFRFGLLQAPGGSFRATSYRTGLDLGLLWTRGWFPWGLYLDANRVDYGDGKNSLVLNIVGAGLRLAL